MRSSGRSATSGSRLFWIIRNAASCGQPRQLSEVPRGARTVRAATVTVSIVHRSRNPLTRRAMPLGLVHQTARAMQLSIVIPAHNEETTVAGVVSGHRDVARSLTSSFEIVVCDDGSTDGTWAALESSRDTCPELRLARNSSRAGIPFTMKRLYADARGDWIYFAP